MGSVVWVFLTNPHRSFVIPEVASVLEVFVKRLWSVKEVISAPRFIAPPSDETPPALWEDL